MKYNSSTEAFYYIHAGNGGLWKCGVCDYTDFDLRIICLGCNQGIRPAFRSNSPWICLVPTCGYTTNDMDRDTCYRCHTKKWSPPMNNI